MSSRLIVDIETNGLLPELTKVHCISIMDRDTKEIISCADQEGYVPIREGLEIIQDADRVYGHNLIGFDIPALRKVYPDFEIDEKEKVVDSLLCAQLRFAHVEDYDYKLYNTDKLPGNLIGSHKLEAWGIRLGVWKGDYDGGWETWSPAMSSYCNQDALVTDSLLDHLQESGLPPESVKIEHHLAIYLRDQEYNGFPFDVVKATRLQAKLSGLREELESRLVDKVGWWWGSKGTTVPKISRTLRKGKLCPQHHYHVPREEQDQTPWGRTQGQYTRLEKVYFNPGSRQHIYTVLQRDYGWEPEVFTDNSGEPKVSEDILEGLDYDIAEDLVEYLTVKKRLGQIAEGSQNWLGHVEQHELTGFNVIRHRCYQKPRTGRQAHSSPNLAQVPANYSDYGEESRECFRAPDGWVMLGSDVDGLELRVVAHYARAYDDGEYAEIILDGDPHNKTLEAIRPAVENAGGEIERPGAKTFNYAYLYGAGDEKLGRSVMAGLTESVARKVGSATRHDFEQEVPGLGELNTAVQQVANSRGYVRLIDGRRAYPRASYAALNTLVQGTGGIICKLWTIFWAKLLEKEFGPQGWLVHEDGSRIHAFAGPRPGMELTEGSWCALANVHDENQLAVKPEIAERAGELSGVAIRGVQDHFDFSLPLSADYDIGSSWKETH